MYKLAFALGAAALAAAAPAGAVVVSFTTSSPGSFVLFDGTAQKTQLNWAGCPGVPFHVTCQTSPNLAVGVPLTVTTGYLTYQIGTHNGAIFNGPSTSFTFDTVYTFGSQSVTLTQSVSFQQILPPLFRLDVGNSETRTIDLGAAGLLDITAIGRTVNLQAINSGGGALVQTRLLLRPAAAPPVPEPASWAMMILGFGVTGGALRRRRAAPALA